VYLHVLWQVLGIDRHARRYVTTLAQTRAELRQRAPGSLDAHDLLDRLDALGRRLLGPYSVSIVNDAITQQYLAALGKLIDRYELGGLSASLANDLLAGETGMESVAPVRSLLALAEQVRQRPELRALFDGDLAAPEVWRRVHEEPDCAMFRAELGRHLELYGDRTLHELKLETPQAEDNPAFVVAMLRNYLRGGQNVEALEARERHRRQVAEEAVARALRRRPLRRWLFGWVLRKVRRGVKHREDLRLARSRGYGLVKRVYRALGAHFVDAGALAAPADVFWLTAEEVAGFVRGHAVSCDLRTVVAQRQREYEGFRLTRPPPRLTTHGLVYRQPFVGCASAGAGDGEVLQGIGCCSGRVRAPAKVILDPSEDLRIGGEILVAPMTDPGWVFLMVAAGGIVSEKGSLLSHTAIIGRELGVPTVVGVPAAASRIADGEMIELDGTAGTVRRVKPPAPAPAE
jgi:pyruvate,water dikinase